MFITSIIAAVLALVAVGVLIFGRRSQKKIEAQPIPERPGYGYEVRRQEAIDGAKIAQRIGGIASAVLVAISALFLSFSTIYTQDPGEANVLRSWTGEVVGYSTGEGLKFKAPWVDRITYDIRNQQVVFANPAGEEPKNANGPQITVQDREGVSANVDISVRYSVDPEAVRDIYANYQTQENFVSKFIENDIRAGVRTVPVQYGTLELLNSRAEVEQKVTEYLAQRWDGAGVNVESVSLQEIRYSDDVKARFDEAQNARTEVEKAEAELDKSKIDAQQKVAQAEAEAEANRILAESLSDEILQQRYLDTLKELAKGGNTIVVPEGFNGLVNVGGEKK